MKTRFPTFAAFAMGCLLAISTPIFSQTEQKSDLRPAQALYEDANGYLGRAYAEFNKKKLSYDSQLEAKTKQEQKDRAIQNANELGARKSLSDEDLYYLGMLRHLSGDSDATLEVMRKYLAHNSKGEKPQIARAVLVLHASKKNLLSEAENVVAAYRKAEPIDVNELFGMETLLADGFNKVKDYERMAVHARGMLEAAKRETKPKLNTFKRDERLFKGSSVLADALVKLNQQDAAIATIENLVKLSIALPSGNLYRMARFRLAGLNPTADPSKWSTPSADTHATLPPEIVAAEWIDQEPTKLADLRGQVVLLDFWAPWCGPCQYVFPKLQAWQEKYKDKGLVILGVTKYFGLANGRKATHAEEAAYLRDFKKRNRLPYGFVVSDSSVNDINYGISSIPMSFLIDRNGNVRFIAVGANDQETTALGKMIKQLLDEPVKNSSRESGQGSARANK